KRRDGTGLLAVDGRDLADRVQIFPVRMDVHKGRIGSLAGESDIGQLAGIGVEAIRIDAVALAGIGVGADVDDVLGGRRQRGLGLAAEYIAAQFRRAGLEPAGDDGYFQTADMIQLTPDPEGFEMKLHHGEDTVTIPRKNAVPHVARAVELTDTQLFRAVGT